MKDKKKDDLEQTTNESQSDLLLGAEERKVDGMSAEAQQEGNQEPTQPVSPKDLPYEVLRYAGKPLLRCKQCAWDTLKGVEAMREHLLKHAPPETKPAILVADKHGKEVK